LTPRRGSATSSGLIVLISLVTEIPPRSQLFPYTTLFRSSHIKKGATVIGLVSPYQDPQRFKQAASHDLTVFSMELIPRITRAQADRKSTRLNSSHVKISYAVFCMKKQERRFTHSSLPMHS